MIKQTINLGTGPNTKTGDSAKVGGQKINTNFDYLFSKVLPLPSGDFRLVAKGWGNTAETDEVGDLFMGWKDAATFWKIAKWNGGDQSNRANYTPIEWIEF